MERVSTPEGICPRADVFGRRERACCGTFDHPSCDESEGSHGSEVELEPLAPRQIARFRAMTAGEKWNAAEGLLRTERQTLRMAIKMRHPAWTAEQVEREAAREIACART